MVRIYYMNLESDCSAEQSLDFLYEDFDGKKQFINEKEARFYTMLPQERRESVDRAKNIDIARKRLYTGAFLQTVLSKETGIPVEQLVYRYNQWGKPELDMEQPFYFNLSHSGKYVVLAVSDFLVGIDIEYKKKNYEAVAFRCFCKEEYEDILSGDTRGEQERRFLEYWTMKEAYIKCVGEGLRIPLNSFLINRKENEVSNVVDENMYLKTFFLNEEYCVSICVIDKRECNQYELLEMRL